MNGFSKKTLVTFFTSVFIFLLDIVVLILISRILGPNGKGIYTLTLLIPTLLATFGNFGIASANVYFVGAKKYKTEDIISNSFIFSIIIGAFLVFLFFCLSNLTFFTNFIKSAQLDINLLWLVVLVIPVSLFSSMLQSIIQGREEIIKYNKINIIQSSAQFLAILLFLVFLRKGVLGAISAYVVSILCSFVFCFYLIRKVAKFRVSFHKKVFFDSLVFGFKVYLANILSYLNYRLDMLIIAVFLDPVAIGIYSIAVGMAEKLFIIPGAVSVVLFPRISSIAESEANDFTPKAVRKIMFLLTLSCIGLAIFIKPIIYILFGPAFLPAFLPFLILLPGIIAFGLSGTLASDLSGRGKPQYAILSSITCLVVNIILNIILIPRWGISGAAFASTVGYWADTVVIIWAFSKISKKGIREFIFIKKGEIKEYLLLIPQFIKYIYGR